MIILRRRLVKNKKFALRLNGYYLQKLQEKNNVFCEITFPKDRYCVILY